MAEDKDTPDTGKKAKEEQISDKERIDKGQILTRIIIEVLGAPKEHVEEAIKVVVDKVREMEPLEVVSESTYEAEEKGKLFSTFSEIEMWFDNIDVLMKFIFEFTPSSVEIIQPSNVSLKANLVSGLFNDFLLKMHDLGLKLKDSSAKTKLLQQNADALVRNFFKLMLKEPKSAPDIAKISGIPEDNVKAILSGFEKAGIVEKKDDLYSMIEK
jgi:hypothetical protein